MRVDPVVVVAQIVNFLLLVWLLKRFLFQPVSRMMKAREEAAQRRLADVQALEAKAREALEAYEARQRALDEDRERLMEEAKEAARKERTRLFEEVADDAKAARARLEEAFARERHRLETALKERLVDEVLQTSGHVVASLSGASLEDAVIDAFERRCEGLEAMPVPPGSEVQVRTSFEPTPRQKERLEAAARRLAGAAGADAACSFHVDEDLVLGVEVQGGGTAVSWSARDLLEDVAAEARASWRAAAHFAPGGAEKAEAEAAPVPGEANAGA